MQFSKEKNEDEKNALYQIIGLSVIKCSAIIVFKLLKINVQFESEHLFYLDGRKEK